MFVNFDVWHLDLLCLPVLVSMFEGFRAGSNKSRWLVFWHAALSCSWTDHSELSRVFNKRGFFFYTRWKVSPSILYCILCIQKCLCLIATINFHVLCVLWVNAGFYYWCFGSSWNQIGILNCQ